MSAEIIRLADVRARRLGSVDVAETQVVAALLQENSPRFHFWTGASGRRYVHTVYSLFDCPPLEDANYVLVRRHDKATRTVMAIGRLANGSSIQNLLEIRHHATEFGADEVHVHLLAGTLQEACAVEADLINAQLPPADAC